MDIIKREAKPLVIIKIENFVIINLRMKGDGWVGWQEGTVTNRKSKGQIFSMLKKKRMNNNIYNNKIIVIFHIDYHELISYEHKNNNDFVKITISVSIKIIINYLLLFF